MTVNELKHKHFDFTSEVQNITHQNIPVFTFSSQQHTKCDLARRQHLIHRELGGSVPIPACTAV